MLRILQSVNIMDRAGLETMLMNYYRHIDKSVIQFDFLTHRPQEGAYETEIKEFGGRVYHAPRLYLHNLPTYSRFMLDFFANHEEYRIIHSHIDAMSYFPLHAAKRNNIPVRIAHSHSSKLDKDLKLPIKYLALKFIPDVANVNCACGEVAGEFMFPNRKFRVINNAIDLDKFKYNEKTRKELREKLGLANKFVIGHVGRFCYIKNQEFLLQVFSEVKKIRTESALLLVGKGPDEQLLREKAKKLGIYKDVVFLIDRPDVDKLYQVFDVFVMPSLFEGLPVVCVEAQANGLRCLVSDKISKEVILTDNIEMMSLGESANNWADRIINLNVHRNPNAKLQLQNKGYDIVVEAEKLQNWYLELDKEKGIKEL